MFLLTQLKMVMSHATLRRTTATLRWPVPWCECNNAFPSCLPLGILACLQTSAHTGPIPATSSARDGNNALLDDNLIRPTKAAIFDGVVKGLS